MADRPILFSAPMIRALLDGRKAQTRRTLKFQPAPGISIVRKTIRPIDAEPYHSFERRSLYGNYAGELDIRMKRGDRLWAREAWSGLHAFRDTPPAQRESVATPDGPLLREDIWCWADGSPTVGDYERPRPSLHMPRWASRLTLIVTDVRVERLQDISGSDAIAEGAEITCEQTMTGPMVKVAPGTYLSPVAWYHRLWDEINGPGAWDLNPWVAAYTFTVHQTNIDQMEVRHVA